MRLFSAFVNFARSGVLANEDGSWIENYWEEGVNDLLTNLDDFGSRYNFNPGQQAIISDSRDFIQNYLIQVGQDYEPADFLFNLQSEIGDAKFLALSETWENLANKDLLELYDHSAGGDGFAKKRFLGVTYG
jgi:hypothetical protein